MGVFSRVFKKADSSTSSRAQSRNAREGHEPVKSKPKRYEDAWARKEVGADEVQELLHVCTQEMKSRALDTPFLLLPFRPGSDSNASKTFVRNFFQDPHQYTGSYLLHETRIMEPMVLCSIMKWCWSRLEGGVVGWSTYELFRQGERESHMAKHAFDTFIPISVESEARKLIIFDFFELLAAVAANGKTNGLGGRKLSRLAGWWAFDHSDTGKGFDGGYQSWASAAAATAHLFFAYLRSLAPENVVESTVSKLSRSLQSLLAQTEYPPDTPIGLLSPTSKVVMVVSTVSATPFALLRRAKNFDYEDDDSALQTFSDYNDPIQALTPECRRVLEAISSTNTSSKAVPEFDLGSPSTNDESWSKFQDMGFSSVLDGADDTDSIRTNGQAKPRRSQAPRRSGVTDLGRPATPSWGDFMSSGFSDDDSGRAPKTLLLPPEQLLPPLSPGRVSSSQSHVKGMRDESGEPGELAGVTRHDMDETFWWVWMTSLAHEEPLSRKAVFGRCAFVETNIAAGRWLVVEEQVKGAASVPQQTVMVRPKKNRFASFTKEGRRNRRMSMGQDSTVPPLPYATAPQPSKVNIGPDQHARVQAAAAALVRQKIDEEEEETVGRRRGRTNEQDDTKTQSVMSLGLQPMLAKEATPALQWARKFDKENTRQQYLGDNAAGKGLAVGHSPTASTINLETALSAGDATDRARKNDSLDKELPSPPRLERGITATDFLSEESKPSAPTKQSPISYDVAPSGSSMDAVRQLQQQAEPRAASKPARIDNSNVGESSSPNNRTSMSNMNRKPVRAKGEIGRDSPAILNGPAPIRPSTDHRPVTPKQSPAVIAAVTASRKSPKSQSDFSPTQQASRKASTKGFRTMFNKRKTQGADTLATQKPVNGSNMSVDKQPVSRTSSFMRRKQVSPKPELDAPAIPKTPNNIAASSAPPISTSHMPSASDEAARIRQDAARSRQERYISMDGGEPGPEESTHETFSHDEPRQQPLEQPRAPFTQNPNQSSGQFSNFTQGPLDDVPAFVPDEEHVEPAARAPSPPRPTPSPTPPPAMPGSFTTRAAAFLAPERPAPAVPQPTKSETPTATSSDFRTPMETFNDDPMDAERTPIATPQPATPADEPAALPLPSSKPAKIAPPRTRIIPDTQVEETAADRWAQIRKNAADRRENQQRSGNNNVEQQKSQQSVVSEKTDDGETSGEETIESRVARIKARVAELTGSSQGVPTRT